MNCTAQHRGVARRSGAALAAVGAVAIGVGAFAVSPTASRIGTRVGSRQRCSRRWLQQGPPLGRRLAGARWLASADRAARWFDGCCGSLAELLPVPLQPFPCSRPPCSARPSRRQALCVSAVHNADGPEEEAASSRRSLLAAGGALLAATAVHVRQAGPLLLCHSARCTVASKPQRTPFTSAAEPALGGDAATVAIKSTRT